MKQFSKIFIIASAILTMAASCNLPVKPQPSPTATSTVEQERVPGTQTSFYYAGIKGQTAISLLKLYHKLETKDFGPGLGEFVTSIDGIKPAAGEFWAFYVNGKSSTVGASSYVTRDKDQIEWRLERIRN